MKRTGLARFGFTAQTVLREPVTDADDLRICPECGHPVGTTKGPQQVEHPEIVEGADPEVVGERLPTYGWVCERHNGYEVVMPLFVGADDSAAAHSLTDGWVTVRVRYADNSVRWIPAPAREVRASQDRVDDSSTTAGSATRRGDVDEPSTGERSEEAGSA